MVKPAEKGFTLIELVVVIAVLAVLGSIAVPRLTDLTDQVGLVDVQRQARAIQTRDRINVISCGSNGLDCTNLTETGFGGVGACKRNADAFFLNKDNSDWEERYGIETMGSHNVTDEERQNQLAKLIEDGDVTEEAALFTLKRFTDSKNETGWNSVLPCVIYKK